MADFFISYNKADVAWAEWIAWQLEHEGYEVIVQVWDFRPGHNFVLKMQEAISESERTIAILSPDFLNSSYTQPEWAAVFAVDPEGEERKLLPVRVRECKPKGLLLGIDYIDLVHEDKEDSARETLLAGISDDVRPASSPDFPRTHENSESEQPAFPGPEKDSAKPGHPKPETPYDLPYLSDCDIQEGELRDALIAFQKERPGSPFICFIHGDEKNCCLGYMSRLGNSLGKNLGRDLIKKNHVSWPSHDGGPDKRFRTLLYSLSDELGVQLTTETNEQTSEVKKLWKEICETRQNSVFLVMSTIYAEKWRDDELELIKRFADFWRDCPPLPDRCFLFICLRVIYEKLGKLSFTEKCLGQKRQQKKLDKRNESIRQSIEGLSFPPNLYGLTLTKLSDIGNDHALNWVKHREVQHFFCNHVQESKLLRLQEELCREIREMYGNPPCSFPMEELAKKLRELSDNLLTAR